jgi:LAS superfamily LD-carboxypeptidase LdcB
MNMKMTCLKLAGLWLVIVAECLAQGKNPADVNTLSVENPVIVQEINVARLSDADRAMVERVLGDLSPLILERRQKSNLATLTFEELYAPLDEDEKVFLKRFQSIDPNLLELSIPFQGIPQEAPELVVIKGQKVKPAKGKAWTIPPQFLPKDVHEAYEAMMAAMKKDIGRTLYVESGYRSAAYQLYLFISYLKNHQYSIRETTRFSAWPGYSEHGWPEHQAIDFTNEQGINGHYNTAAFEALEEYQWLLKNAGDYGFELSYPKESKMTFEPWHWRYNKMIQDK